jgi:hypothetical protein
MAKGLKCWAGFTGLLNYHGPGHPCMDIAVIRKASCRRKCFTETFTGRDVPAVKTVVIGGDSMVHAVIVCPGDGGTCLYGYKAGTEAHARHHHRIARGCGHVCLAASFAAGNSGAHKNKKQKGKVCRLDFFHDGSFLPIRVFTRTCCPRCKIFLECH